MPEMDFPIKIDTTPDYYSLYLGISKQDLQAHQAICELIDNAISATQEGENFTIEIHIEKEGEIVKIKVADCGIGISLNDISKKILKIGGKGSTRGILNEHGFGLKNSLCVLTGNNRDFSILTRDKEALEKNLYYKVRGPFKRDMVVEEGGQSEWNENIERCLRETGTRVFAETTMHYLKTIYPSGSLLETLMERLMEQLGVLYRNYLTDLRNVIWIKWRDITNRVVDWNTYRVVPISIPYLKSKEELFTIDHNGKIYKAKYKWGNLDESEIEDSSKGKPYPLRIYYQKNQKTQGIDICIRGRIILAHVLEYLWPELNRHNDFNSFVGELILDDPEFSTVNNKTQLDPNNPIWEILLEKLQSDNYKPPRTESSVYTEKEIRKKLTKKLKSIVSRSKVQEDVPIWSGLGVKVDIIHTYPDGKEQIYEIKPGTARPINVYQLVMYWDGRVKDEISPQLGILVAKNANENILSLIEYWNSRKDEKGNNYNLEFKKLEDLV